MSAFLDVARDDDDDDDDLEAPVRVESPNGSFDWMREASTLRVLADISWFIIVVCWSSGPMKRCRDQQS